MELGTLKVGQEICSLRVGGIIISLLMIEIVSLKPIGLMRIVKLLRMKMAKI